MQTNAIYHATWKGQEGYAKKAEHAPCWLFVPAGQVYDVTREELVLLGEVNHAAEQRRKDGNLAAKVCGY